MDGRDLGRREQVFQTGRVAALHRQEEVGAWLSAEVHPVVVTAADLEGQLPVGTCIPSDEDLLLPGTGPGGDAGELPRARPGPLAPGVAVELLELLQGQLLEPFQLFTTAGEIPFRLVETVQDPFPHAIQPTGLVVQTGETVARRLVHEQGDGERALTVQSGEIHVVCALLHLVQVGREGVGLFTDLVRPPRTFEVVLQVPEQPPESLDLLPEGPTDDDAQLVESALPDATGVETGEGLVVGGVGLHPGRKHPGTVLGEAREGRGSGAVVGGDDPLVDEQPESAAPSCESEMESTGAEVEVDGALAWHLFQAGEWTREVRTEGTLEAERPWRVPGTSSKTVQPGIGPARHEEESRPVQESQHHVVAGGLPGTREGLSDQSFGQFGDEQGQLGFAKGHVDGVSHPGRSPSVAAHAVETDRPAPPGGRLFLYALLGSAFASYTVSAPPLAEKSEANSLNRDARDAGHKGRVVRRFVEGEGWEYVVEWTFEDLAEAEAAVALLTETTGRPLELSGTDGAPVEVDAPPVVPEVPTRDWMGEALEAHGQGAQILSDAERIQVVFLRELPDGRVARHVYVRRGTDQRLAITAEKGEVVPSVTVAVGERAWLETGGTHSDQDLQRTREKLEGFALQSLAPLVLALDRAVREHPDLEGLVEKGKARVDGVACEVAGSPDGRTLIAFGPDHLVRRLSVDGGERVYEFAEYKRVEDVMIPHAITRRVGENDVDTIHIELVELDGAIDEAWFLAPG